MVVKLICNAGQILMQCPAWMSSTVELPIHGTLNSRGEGGGGTVPPSRLDPEITLQQTSFTLLPVLNGIQYELILDYHV